MVDIDATFLHDFLKVAIGDRIAHIEKDRVHDHVLGEMASLKLINAAYLKTFQPKPLL
jgi:hypothetical protein